MKAWECFLQYELLSGEQWWAIQLQNTSQVKDGNLLNLKYLADVLKIESVEGKLSRVLPGRLRTGMGLGTVKGIFWWKKGNCSCHFDYFQSSGSSCMDVRDFLPASAGLCPGSVSRGTHAGSCLRQVTLLWRVALKYILPLLRWFDYCIKMPLQSSCFVLANCTALEKGMYSQNKWPRWTIWTILVLDFVPVLPTSLFF